MRSAAMLAVNLTLVLLALAAPAGAAGPEDLTLTRTEHLSPRLQELTFHTLAAGGEAKVRVLLPDGYQVGDSENSRKRNRDAQPARRWPLLLLLHGALDDQRAWTEKGDAEAITRGLPGIVVMPHSGTGGGYVDWRHPPDGHPHAWETYHLDQLLPWIDGHFRTLAKRSARAIAGLSMGGYGAMHYAARRPDLFASATSWSGAVDTNHPALQLVSGQEGISYGQPGAVYGPRLTDEVRWRGHNPWDLAENLRGMDLTIRTGNGMPGGPGGDTGDPVESAVHACSTNLHDRLEALGIAHVWDDYGAGGHAWFYWQRGLRQLAAHLPGVWAAPPRRPRLVTYRSIDPVYATRGWTVRIDRPAVEFSELRDAGSAGFTLLGSGTARVTTPARYRPGSAVTVTRRAGARTVRFEVRAGADRRLRLQVPLGPGNPHQERSPQARLHGGTKVFSTTIGFSRTATRTVSPD